MAIKNYGLRKIETVNLRGNLTADYHNKRAFSPLASSKHMLHFSEKCKKDAAHC